MPFQGIRRRAPSSQLFATDIDFLNLIDIIGHQYGKLPSEVAKMDWFDILLCARCIVARGQRIKRITGSKKKSMIFPVMDISSLADILG